ncbi:MAG TPA: hypothetical protein VMK65_07450 [Longimicrobiales bacterium]|nr:hypothetical protein [Longimicrobiales bacterium]
MSDASTRFRQAHDEGELSAEALDALTIGDIGAEIQAGLGITPDQVPASEVVLVTMMPDDSGSIRFAGAEGAMRDGHNMVLRALGASRQKEGVLAHTRYLNGHVLFPYRRLEDAVELTKSNYAGQLGTPLYDQTAVLLGTVLLKTREFEDAGVSVRTITLILTDGEDAGSSEQDARSVAAIVRDMLRRESHIIAAMGISDGSRESAQRFRSVFREMAIPDEWVLTPANTERDIRAAFLAFSQSALQASQGSAQFGQASLGGFGA